MIPYLPDPFISHHHSWQQPQGPNMNQQRQPAFATHRINQDAGTANELDTLRVHSIELETELRLTKEQLLQAQSGTQYLANCFASQQNRDLVQGYGQNRFELESQNEQLKKEVHRLKGQLLLEEKSRVASPVGWGGRESGWRGGSGGWGRTTKQELEEEVAVLKEQRTSLLNDVLYLLKEDPHDYSFQFDDQDPAAYRPLEYFQDKLAAIESQQDPLREVGLRDQTMKLGSPFDQTRINKEKRVDSPHSSPDAVGLKRSIFVKHDDVALLDFESEEQATYGRPTGGRTPNEDAPLHRFAHTPSQLPQLHSANQSSVRHIPAQRQQTPPRENHDRTQYSAHQAFAPFERQYLMSNAIFIEGKEGDEYLEFWESLEDDVKRFAGRHTKEEWKAYYEMEVRPMFLEKMAQRQALVVEEREQEAQRGEVLHSQEADVIFEAQESERTTEHADEEMTGNQAISSIRAPVSRIGDEGEIGGGQAPVARDIGMAASQWAVQKAEMNISPAGGDLVNEEDRRALEEDVSSTSKGVCPSGDVSITMPSVPAFGSFDLANSLKPQSSKPQPPIPGLAGGWPKPAPRNNPRFPHRTEAPKAEKDPGIWNHLFFGLERNSERRFVLGKNERFMRTVIINNVPAGMPLLKVVDQVRGGKIVSARFFDTAGLNTKPPITTNTVVVEFLKWFGAKDFIMHLENNPMSFVTGSEQVKADVQLIRTQTVPLPYALQQDLTRLDGALTRILFLIFMEVENAPEPDEIVQEIISLAIHRGYSDMPGNPLRITIAKDGMMLFEYADVRQSAAAWNAVAELERKLGEVSKGFAADPCGRPLGESEGEDKGEAGGKEGEAGPAIVETEDVELEATE